MVYLFFFVFNLKISLFQPKVHTPIDPQGLAEVLRIGYKEVFGEEPKRKTLAMGWAQIGLENGQGKEAYNYNLGNIGAGPNDKFYKVAGSRFKSFSSFKEGSVAYWTHLKEHCKNALLSFEWGNPIISAEYLKNCHYFGADLKMYQSVMNSLFKVAIKNIIPALDR